VEHRSRAKGHDEPDGGPELIIGPSGPWLLPDTELPQGFEPLSIASLSRRISLTDEDIVVENRLLRRLLAPWETRKTTFPLAALAWAAVRSARPWVLIYIDGYIYDASVQARINTHKTARFSAKRLSLVLAWASEANSRAPRALAAGQNTEPVTNPDLIEREVSKLESTIERQWRVDEALNGYATTAIAAFVVLIGLAVNNTQHLPRGDFAHALYFAGLGLCIGGLLTAATTVLPTRMRSWPEPFSVRQYYNRYENREIGATLMVQGELLEKGKTANRLELSLKRGRLTREFIALILGAASIAAAFAT
jgi:hypothetical protein